MTCFNFLSVNKVHPHTPLVELEFTVSIRHLASSDLLLKLILVPLHQQAVAEDGDNNNEGAEEGSFGGRPEEVVLCGSHGHESLQGRVEQGTSFP